MAYVLEVTSIKIYLFELLTKCDYQQKMNNSRILPYYFGRYFTRKKGIERGLSANGDWKMGTACFFCKKVACPPFFF
jgi:hypothetical protein